LPCTKLADEERIGSKTMMDHALPKAPCPRITDSHHFPESVAAPFKLRLQPRTRFVEKGRRTQTEKNIPALRNMFYEATIHIGSPLGNISTESPGQGEMRRSIFLG
jgi:hypothetical protein